MILSARRAVRCAFVLPWILLLIFVFRSSPPEPQVWVAQPWAYDYAQFIELSEGRQGRLLWGDSQVIRHTEKIVYDWKETGKETFLFSFESREETYSRKFSCKVRRETGRYRFEEEYTGRVLVFSQRLVFEKCPFGLGLERVYYGHPVEE